MPFFNLVLVHNTGAAFSFLAGAGGWQRWFFTVVTVAVICAAIVVMLRRLPDNRLLCAGLALVLGGALGNLYDRLTLGHVVDFVQLHAGGYFPSFNVADSAITVGVVLLIWDGLRGRRGRQRGRIAPAAGMTEQAEVLLAKPRGFCAGVDRAIEIVERALSATARPSTCATRSCTTSSWSRTCAPRAPSSSRSSTRCPPGAP